MQSVELHLHTWDSLLDGLNNSEEYMARASELGMTHLAITDHGTLSGHREFQRAAKNAGITPILGCEMYISATDRFDKRSAAKRDDSTQAFNHLTVLAQNELGLKNLNRLSEIAWTEGFYSKPRIDLDALEEYNEGLIVLSGCLNGLISKALENGDEWNANMYARRFKDILGDRFFMEIQGHNPVERNHGLLAIAEKYKIKPVVTSDCHYARKEDLWLEEAMLILSMGPKESKNFDFTKSQKMNILDRFNYAFPDRKMTFQEIEIFLRSAEDHEVLLAKQGIGTEAIENTLLVAEMIGEYPYHEGLDLLPKLYDNPDEVLREKVIAGAKKRGTFGIPEYDARREEELGIHKQMGFAPYILTIEDIISWAHSQDIWVGPGRGSGVGSLVNYELGITQADPIKRNLLFFRFVNPERNDFPDIDTDIEIKRRGEVKEYILRKYGHAASIATFGTFQGKNSVRDASRVFRVPLGDVNRALKGADWPAEMDFFEQWKDTERGKEFIKAYPEVIKLAKFLYGRKRTQGMHAGGIVVSNQPISDYAPMQSVKDTQDDAAPRIPLIALDMNEAADVGLIKMDFLGLKAGTIIQQTLGLIKERHDIHIDLYQLDYADPVIYKRLSEGHTKGVFQAEAAPYTNMLIDMGGVKNFEELVASNALVRPGAMKSTAGKAFIARKAGLEEIDYPHEKMKWFTEETYGVVIYQEQVMLTMTELAGMSMATADKVRKIIGKKRNVKEFEQYKKQFIDGASKNVSKKVAERLWKDFEAHAGYSFNKSHAEAYSMISYWTAWLKEYYPLEFMCAVLKEETEKDSRLDYLIETKRMGVRTVLPHVNASGIDFEIQNVDGKDAIRFGLSNIKFISKIIGRRLIEARPYDSYENLVKVATTKYSGIGARAVDSLNKVGAAAFDDNPRTGRERDNYYEYLAIPAFKTNDLSRTMKDQFRPLDEFSPDESFVSLAMVRGIKTGPGWARAEIVDETGSAGVFMDEHHTIESGQMYAFLITKNRIARYVTIDELMNDQGGDFQEFLEATGYPDMGEGHVRVVSFNSRMTRAGKRMADVTFCDEEKNMMTALVWPANFAMAHTKCKEGNVVRVTFEELEDGGYAVQSIG